MPRLVSLVGKSPGTLHTVLCLLRERGVNIDHGTVIATREREAQEALEIARSCPCPRGGPPLSVTGAVLVILPYGDVDTHERLQDFRQRLRGLLDTSTVLDVTGGRKAMTIAAAIEAIKAGTAIVLAQIPWNRYLETAKAQEPCNKTAENATLLTF